MENTTRLIESGIYHYIRHPLYLSLILLGTGAFLKNIDQFRISLAVINILSLLITARIEEKEMIEKFGDSYKLYMRKTKRFMPYIY